MHINQHRGCHNSRRQSFNMASIKAPTPPFTRETAIEKIRMAENAWNSKNPEIVKMAYSEDTIWRNRHIFVRGREEVQNFLKEK
jgi:uncharacterized protein